MRDGIGMAGWVALMAAGRLRAAGGPQEAAAFSVRQRAAKT
jgi:hypothetical protein